MDLNGGYINEIVHEVSLLITNENKFEEEITDFCFKTEEKYQHRLFQWLHFFNIHHSKNPCIYTQTVFALFDFGKNNELFRIQTEHEFQASLLFYQKIINSPYLIEVTRYELACRLLSIALIYGKYGSMQIRPFSLALETIKSNVTNETIDDFFGCLFIKYQVPKLFVKNISLLNYIETNMLMFVLQGNNPKKLPELDFKLSSREAHYLIHNFPTDVVFEDNVLKKAAAISKIFLANGDFKINDDFFDRRE